jgi:hypothetical protein
MRLQRDPCHTYVAQYPRDEVIKVCSCGEQYTRERWWLCWAQQGCREWHVDEEYCLHLLDCSCGSTIAIEINR